MLPLEDYTGILANTPPIPLLFISTSEFFTYIKKCGYSEFNVSTSEKGKVWKQLK
jgi:hypothetical protein